MQDSPDWKRLADDTYVSGIQHNDEGERALAVLSGLPERHGDRVVSDAAARTAPAFGDPLVSPEP
jgi:hypothetical protein